MHIFFLLLLLLLLMLLLFDKCLITCVTHEISATFRYLRVILHEMELTYVIVNGVFHL